MEVSMYDKLLQLPLFQGLCKDDFTSILGKVKFHFKTYKKGDCIVTQNTYCNNIIFVLQGEVRSEALNKKYHYSIQEYSESPYVLEPYSVFGMYPQYTASYFAETDVDTVYISKSYILPILNKYEIFQLNYLNLLSNRSQVLYNKICDLQTGSTLNNFIYFLQIHCSSLKGKKCLQGKMEDIANILDDTRLNISKMLNDLENKGLVILRRKEIYIRNLEWLIDYALHPEELIKRNPFLQPYRTEHDTVPFDSILYSDYEPAIQEGIRQENKEIEAITNNPEAPTFNNTIVALEQSGKLLERVTTVFFNLLSAETCDAMEAIAQKVMPDLSNHNNDISLNPQLFQRVKQVYESRDKLNLTQEESALLNKTYDGFIRKGAGLSEKDKEKFRKISTELSLLTLTFSQNVLKETNKFEMLLTSKEQLKGLPESSIIAAAHAAKDKRVTGWVITLKAPSYVPFMKYSEIRELRKKLYMAYNTQCVHNNTYNNEEIVKKIVNLRMQLAQLLGYTNYADYVLRKRMAENSNQVYQLLNDLIKAYLPTAQQGVKEVEEFARQTEGQDFELMPWDFSYYSEKLKQQKYHFCEEELRPYFELSQVQKGIFGLATRLYGITFKKNKNIPVYHPDVTAYEVYDSNNNYLAILYTDFFPRKGKHSGAWMTNYKEQWIDSNGINSRPHVSIVTNFTKPTSRRPALLTFSEVNTFLHEFGHALHGIFANTRFKSMSGTNVYWDFVELPSQIMENYATEKDFLNTFAQHFQTKKPIPEEMIQRIIDSSNFNIAYSCIRQVSFGLLDMAWYTRNTAFEDDIRTYEQNVFSATRLLPEIKDTCMSVQFSHIMSGGYAAGYYSYKWAEVLDADAFSVFKKKGIFNPEVAQSFRQNILSKGGTEHPMTLYKRFRQQKPTVEALLKRNGIK